MEAGDLFLDLVTKMREKQNGQDPEDGYKLLLLGIEDSGKTTLLYKLKLGEKVECIPTIGFNVE